MNENQIAKNAVDAAYKIHKKYGPGLLEKTYEAMMAKELRKRGYFVERQKSMPLIYEDEVLDEAYIIDLYVNESLIIELKATEKTLPVYKRQVLTYLKVAEKPLGLLINFGLETVKEGIERVINGSLD